MPMLRKKRIRQAAHNFHSNPADLLCYFVLLCIHLIF